jgi:hypothetical protein
MKVIRTLIIILPVFFTSCEKNQTDDIPECISDLVEGYSFCATSGRTIDQYSFQGQTVYVYTPSTQGNDIASAVYNENCENIGILGGIAGINIINNELFFGNAIFQKTICPPDSL